jgi:predicted metal-binding membrane protein
MSVAMENDKMMAAMGMTMGWTAADAILTFAMWSVMMIGMMVPSAMPVILLFAATQAKRVGRQVTSGTLLFCSGYIAVWCAFSAAATLTQWELHRMALLSSGMATSNWRLSAAILIAAGVYQVTPWKNKCLVHCRSPIGFLMTNWHDGPTGAFQMGARHGGFCLGCCWALMLVLFVVGVMNLLWVAILTIFVLAEKIGPASIIVGRIAGVVLLVAGLVSLLRS